MNNLLTEQRIKTKIKVNSVENKPNLEKNGKEYSYRR